MCDLSEFMKTLKQRVSQSYNKRHNRKGTVWEARFKSILIQPGSHRYNGKKHPLAAVAAYIDLNAVRAGIVSDPKDYPFCGYAEAVAGLELAQHGIGTVMLSLGQADDWEEAANGYRRLLYLKETAMRQTADTQECRVSTEEPDPEVKCGAPALPEMLRCRIPEFIEGVVLGSRAFVEQTINQYSATLGIRRRNDPHRVPGSDGSGLCTLRRPRTSVAPHPAGN